MVCEPSPPAAGAFSLREVKAARFAAPWSCSSAWQQSMGIGNANIGVGVVLIGQRRFSSHVRGATYHPLSLTSIFPLLPPPTLFLNTNPPHSFPLHPTLFHTATYPHLLSPSPLPLPHPSFTLPLIPTLCRPPTSPFLTPLSPAVPLV